MKIWKVGVLISVLQIPVATAQAQEQPEENASGAGAPAPAVEASEPSSEPVSASSSAPATSVAENPAPSSATQAPLNPPPQYSTVANASAVAVPDLPRKTRYFAALVMQNTRLQDRGAQLFSNEQDVSGAGLLLLAQVRELAPKWMLSVGGEWQHLQTEGAWTFGETSMRSNTLAATAVLRYEHASWLRPFARVAAGGRSSHYKLGGLDPSFSDSGWAPFGSVSAGVGIMRAARDSMPVGFSFDLEGGLAGAGEVSVKASARGSQKDGIIAVSGPTVGEQGGLTPMFRLVFGLHF